MTPRPLRGKVLAVQYEKPETTPSGLILPQQSRRDTTNQYWEIVAVGEGVEEELGFRLPKGAIAKTRWGEGTSLGQDLEGTNRPLFVLSGERVTNVVLPDWEVDF